MTLRVPDTNGAMNDRTQERQLRLVLLDDHGLLRACLSRVLAAESDFEVAAECGTSAEALETLNGSPVDVVLLDFNFGTEHGNDFISAARQAGYTGRFLIVAGAADARNSAIALKLGASGIFLKSESPQRLVQAIRLVGNGGSWVDQKIIQRLAGQVIDRYPRLDVQRSSDLSGGFMEDRERHVLQGIMGGLTNRKIGDNIGLSESNVKNVVQRLFGKAGVKRRSQLVRAALEGSLGAPQDLVKQPPNEMPAPPNFHERQPLSANPPAASQPHQ
jgi:two-component system nitrate/nitrite response regulator NarL